MILERLVEATGVTIVDVKTNYPNGLIDVEKEQRILKEFSTIVLQFPFVWYSMPSHFKAWVENVFTEGFAYGKNGDALRKKKLLLSVTLGGSCSAYSTGGQHQHPVEYFLKPLELFVNYCGLEYLPPVYSYSMVASSPDGLQILQNKAELHADRVVQTLQKHECHFTRLALT